MKKFMITSVLAVLIQALATVQAQNLPEEYLGLPGDNLNLYAVMKLFQESETLEGFERNLNDENSRINNLDLNGDNLVDYIAAFDYVDGDVHTIVLRAVLGQNEYQDVAVFTVERFRNGSVQIQLIGDEALYGRNYIIEPIYAETPNPGYIGTRRNSANVTVVTTTYYEVAAWPLIRFIYLPDYIVWCSSWYWGYYPVYWRPWNPFYWHFYYGYHYNWYAHYYRYYRHWDHLRFVRYNDFYYGGIRIFSPMVVININKGNYKSTYSRPEQRRDGEALYSKVYASQGTGAPNSPAVSNQERRSLASPSAGAGATAGTGSDTQRRAIDNASNGPENSNNAGQNTETARRSSTTVTGTAHTGTATGQNADAARRTSTTVTGKTAPAASAGQNATTTRRSTSTVTQSNTAGSSSGPNAETTRRSSATVTGATQSGTATGQNTDVARRTSATVTGNTATGASAGQNATTTGRSTSTVTQSKAASPSASQTKATVRSSSSSGSVRQVPAASGTSTVRSSGTAKTSSGPASQASGSSEVKKSSNSRSTANVQSNSNAGGSANSNASRR